MMAKKRASSLSDGIILETGPVDRNDPMYHDAFLEVAGIISEQAMTGKYPGADDLANLSAFRATPGMRALAAELGISSLDIANDPMLIEDIAAYALDVHPDIYDRFLDAYTYSDAVVGSLMGGITDEQKTRQIRLNPKVHGKRGLGYKIASAGALMLFGLAIGSGCIADEKKMDSDKDGISDYDEKNTYHTDPKNEDTDNDGLGDYQEIFQHKTNPLEKDTDKDGFTDGFEVNIAKLDPLVMNDRYVIISSRNYDHEQTSDGKYYAAALQVPDMYKFLTEEGKIPKENIIYLQKPTYTEFKNAVDEIAKKADDNDIVFIELHGETMTTIDYLGREINHEYIFSDKEVSPSQIGSLLDKIHAKSTTVCVELCKAGYFLDEMNDPGRIVITGSDKTQVSPNADAGMYFFEAMGHDVGNNFYDHHLLNTNPDKDGNGYVSIKEACDIVKNKMAQIKIYENGNLPNNALFSDPSGIAGSTYLLEYKLPEGYAV